MLQALFTLLGYAGVSVARILANELVRWAVILVRLAIAAGITGYLLVQVLAWFFNGVFNAVNIGILIPPGLLQSSCSMSFGLRRRIYGCPSR